MTIEVAIQRCASGNWIPEDSTIRKWVKGALRERRDQAQITIRIVDEREAGELNLRWRGSAGPTNVLAFSFDGLDDIVPALIGDIVICAPVVEREAVQQGKQEAAHWSHMVVHGVLHLLGYEHTEDEDAELMEAEERRILRAFGYPDPYQEASC